MSALIAYICILLQLSSIWNAGFVLHSLLNRFGIWILVNSGAVNLFGYSCTGAFIHVLSGYSLVMKPHGIIFILLNRYDVVVCAELRVPRLSRGALLLFRISCLYKTE